MKLRVVCFLSIVLAVGNAAAQDVNVYMPGQVWTYRTVPGDDASRVVIGKVEVLEKDGMVIHAMITDLSLPDALSPGGGSMMYNITHVPLTKSALDQSVLKLDGSRQIDKVFDEAYAEWREAYDKNQAGLVDRPLADIVKDLRSSGFQPPEAAAE